ncbi:hypothetical protein IW492_16230 [Enterococcus sp. BWB1-3]|uniref:hypothetical protein n=1 Tax=unclassified Enterococcus TaxID=2608891 RepID=UPI001E37DE78|nr:MULTISPECIES: hypothetical protein [unclassified Enterococcus]MBL1230777.1 hypothetical protein [Enterococcus sp. BWB1-3]MCB5953218.1 hypothetical protein [Enterococcus sp. BWT-B8]MCB5956234.1 hypothetical protein [Enterococcus sp. CWB-B31]
MKGEIMKNNYSTTRTMFLITAILGTLVCIPYLTNMIGIGEPVQLAFIVFALVTLFQNKDNKEINKRGLKLIMTSLVIIIAFIIAILITTNSVSLTMFNVFEFASSANSSSQFLIATLGVIGLIVCAIGVVFCYLDYFNLKKLAV